MAHPILMPKPGQMTEECVLTLWRKEVGDPVHRGDVLFEIETDKSSMEVETFDEGVLLAKLVQDGETAPVNAVCGWIGQAGEAVPDAPAAPAPAAVAAPAVAEVAAAPVLDPAPEAAPGPAPDLGARGRPGAQAAPVAQAAPSAPGGKIRISPRASRLAAQAGIDPLTVTGTGPDGRIVERDIAAAVDARSAAPAPAAAPAAAPAVGAAPAAAPAAAAPVVPMAVAPVEGEEAPRPMSRMRRTIAARLTNSWQTTPHFTVTVAVDVTRVLALRAELKAEGHSLTVTDFVLAATAQTLAEFPDVNSRTDGEVVYPRRRVHLGVAVSRAVRPRRAGRPGRGPHHHRRAPRPGRRPGRRRARGHDRGRRPDGLHLHGEQPRDVRGRGVQRDHQPRRGRDPGRVVGRRHARGDRRGHRRSARS